MNHQFVFQNCTTLHLRYFAIFYGYDAVAEANGTVLVAYYYAGAVFEVSYVGEHLLLCDFIESRGCLIEQKNWRT